MDEVNKDEKYSIKLNNDKLRELAEYIEQILKIKEYVQFDSVRLNSNLETIKKFCALSKQYPHF